MFYRLFGYWGSARKETLAGGAILVFAAAVDLLQPWPIKWLVDYVFAGRPAPSPLLRFGFTTNPGDAVRAVAWVCASILVLGVTHKAAQMLSQFVWLSMTMGWLSDSHPRTSTESR